jgi:hypothetical protein
MRQRWIFAAFLVLVIGGMVTAIAVLGPDRDWDRHNQVEVVRVADDGTTTTTGDTIVIERDGRGFFPFGIFFFPLGLLFVFLFFRFLFWGPRRGGPWHQGPWNGGPPPPWLDEWHRRQHQGQASTDDTTATPTGT